MGWGYCTVTKKYFFPFYPTAFKACWGIVFTHGVWMGGWVGKCVLKRAGGWRGKVCPGCISETVRCRKLILGRECRCAASWCDLDLTFDLVVTLSLNILFELYLRNCKV